MAPRMSGLQVMCLVTALLEVPGWIRPGCTDSFKHNCQSGLSPACRDKSCICTGVLFAWLTNAPPQTGLRCCATQGRSLKGRHLASRLSPGLLPAAPAD